MQHVREQAQGGAERQGSGRGCAVGSGVRGRRDTEGERQMRRHGKRQNRGPGRRRGKGGVSVRCEGWRGPVVRQPGAGSAAGRPRRRSPGGAAARSDGTAGHRCRHQPCCKPIAALAASRGEPRGLEGWLPGAGGKWGARAWSWRRPEAREPARISRGGDTAGPGRPGGCFTPLAENAPRRRASPRAAHAAAVLNWDGWQAAGPTRPPVRAGQLHACGLGPQPQDVAQQA